MSESTKWFESPVINQNQWLQPLSHARVKPYFGRAKTICLRRTSYVLGSAEECDLSLEDPFVSKRHAELRLASGGRYEVEDLGSKNGVFLNGTRITRASLPKRGVLRLGRSELIWNEVEEKSLDQPIDADGFLYHSEAMRELMRRARIAALSDLPILILGETGTGKEEIARRVYAWSAQAQGPWIAVNAALAAGNLVDSEMFGHRKGAFTGAESNRQGAIQSAHRGMLFLDELGDLPIDTQAKLLRVLETGEVKPLGGDTYERSDFRLVAATSRKLEESVEKGLFRLDLFHRVSGFVLRIPPLRERNEEIFPLAEFIACHQAGIDISHSCESILKAHAWPGNVRELRATILRGAALAKAEDRTIIETTDLEILQPAIAPRHRESPPATLEAWEAIHVREALTRTGGSRAQAALELGIARSTLFEKIKKHGLGRPEC